MINGRRQKSLRGISFREQQLSGEDFSNCDIRGLDFTHANLTGANFRGVRAGQPLFWIAVIVIANILLTILSGYVSAYSAAGIGGAMVRDDIQPNGLWSSIFSIGLLSSFMFITLSKGLGMALGIFSLLTAFAIVLFAGFGDATATALSIVQAVFVSGAIASSILALINLLVFKITTGKVAPFIYITTFILGGVLGGREGLEWGSVYLTQGIPSTVLITAGLLGFSIYTSPKITQQDRKYWLICKASNFLAALGGTRFQGADLTNADFTGATLNSTNFCKAILSRTRWENSRNLEQSYLEGTYLENKVIRNLLVENQGVGKIFEYFDLRGLNLRGANLRDACFIGTDLSETILEQANLAGAKLAKARFYGANLRNANLTGAYIENWSISTDTNLESIACDYIYMRLPTKEDPDACRKPDNRNEVFQKGDFTTFIAPIIKTLDLYQTQNIDLREVAKKFKTLDLFHYDCINPSAAAIALQQVVDQHPEAEIEIIALEGKGSEKFRLQAKVAQGANRSELYEEYFSKYSEIKSLPYSDLQALLIGVTERDRQIQSLEKLLENVLKQPTFYVETYQNKGEFIMTQENKGNVSISGVQGSVTGVAASGETQTITGAVLGTVSGNVTNTINQLPASTDPEEPGLKELLSQLQAAIESEPGLSDEDKTEALEQLRILAEIGQKPNDGILQKAAKTAMKILKGTASSLPEAAKLAEVFTKLLPVISKLLLFV